MSIYLLSKDTVARMGASDGFVQRAAGMALLAVPRAMDPAALAALLPENGHSEEKNPGGDGAFQSALTAVMKFIPAEAITVFVAGAGLISGWTSSASPAGPNHNLANWFYVCAFLAVLFYVLSSLTDAKRQEKHFQVTMLFVWRMIVLLIAFLVWGSAVSGDTLRALMPMAADVNHLHDISAILVLVTSPVLSGIDSVVVLYSV